MTFLKQVSFFFNFVDVCVYGFFCIFLVFFIFGLLCGGSLWFPRLTRSLPFHTLCLTLSIPHPPPRIEKIPIRFLSKVNGVVHFTSFPPKMANDSQLCHARNSRNCKNYHTASMNRSECLPSGQLTAPAHRCWSTDKNFRLDGVVTQNRKKGLKNMKDKW